MLRPVGVQCESYSNPNQFWTKPEFGLAVVLLVAALIAYAPAMRGGFLWDDNDHLSENPTITQPNGLNKIWFDYKSIHAQYYPLVYTTYWLEYHLWGLNPLGYHITNVLLHVCSAIILGQLLGRLAIPGAWLAAAIFALHPICV